jgi:aspartate/methionine/tyrosine aminotransferase
MKNIISSNLMDIYSEIAKKKETGKKIYNFAIGDYVIDNHPIITKSASKFLESSFIPYPPIYGVLELRELATKWMREAYKTDYNLENCIVTCGGKFAIFASLQALLKENDEVLIPSPYWVSFPSMVKICGAKPKILETSAKNNWKITEEDIIKNSSSKTKVLILNNPCNPTGVVYTEKELEKILEAAERANLMVISDEVYSGVVYEDINFVSCGSFLKYSNRVIVCQSCSKNFGMTGWRVGFAFGSKEIIKTLAVIQSQSITNTSLISHHAAIGALKNYKQVNSYIKNKLQISRNLFVDTFNELFLNPIEKPISSMFVFIPLSSLGVKDIDSIDFCLKILRMYNIAMLPGSVCGKEGYVRMTFSVSDETIVEGLKLLHEAIKNE